MSTVHRSPVIIHVRPSDVQTSRHRLLAPCRCTRRSRCSTKYRWIITHKRQPEHTSGIVVIGPVKTCAAARDQVMIPVARMTPTAFVVMGVSGCGKSAVGSGLAQALRCKFYEGDEYHPTANIAKMQSGVPLDDDDRRPWLDALAQIVQDHLSRSERIVLSCSALKPAYRQRLRADSSPAHPTSGSHSPVAFVLLAPSHDDLAARLSHRAASTSHFMPPNLLDSQLSTLQVEDWELWACIRPDAATGQFPSVDAIVSMIMQQLKCEEEQHRATQQDQPS